MVHTISCVSPADWCIGSGFISQLVAPQPQSPRETKERVLEAASCKRRDERIWRREVTNAGVSCAPKIDKKSRIDEER
jgi:hypothetical protein